MRSTKLFELLEFEKFQDSIIFEAKYHRLQIFWIPRLLIEHPSWNFKMLFPLFLGNECYVFIFQTLELWFPARHWCEDSNYSTLRISKCHSWMSVRHLQHESFSIFPTCRVNGTANHAVVLTAMPKSTLRPCIGWHCSRLKLATTATSYT